MDEDAVAEFAGVTTTTPEVARRVLDMCGGDLEQAIMLWFNDEDLQRSMTAAPTVASTTADPAASRGRPPAAWSSRLGREDTSGVIHLDSDDEDADFAPQPRGPNSRVTEAMEIDSDDSNEDEDTVDQVTRVARTAQEDEDAAMAQRLQEELYAQQPAGAVDADGVRAPIARTTETLVAPSGPYMDDDDGEDRHEMMLEHLRRRELSRRAGKLRCCPLPMLGNGARMVC
jgi:UBX domain-containing protein 7